MKNKSNHQPNFCSFFRSVGFRWLLFLVIFETVTINLKAQTWNPVGPANFSAGVADWGQITISKQGIPYVVFADYAVGSKSTVMRYYRGNWENVGTSGFSAGFVQEISIAIDSNGTPYVVYADSINGWKTTVMKYNGTSWVLVGSAGFSAGRATNITMAIDKNGTPFIAYIDLVNSDVTVMKFDGSDWVVVGVAGLSGTYGWSPYITLDNNGTPYVAFADGGHSMKVTVMKFNGLNWVNVGIAGFTPESAENVSLALDPDGMPYASFNNVYNGVIDNPITVMKFNGSNWSLVGSPHFSSRSSLKPGIKIDNSGTPYVCYKDLANANKATVVKYDGSNWVALGGVGFSNLVANSLSLDLDRAGTPYILYSDGTNGERATVLSYDIVNKVNNVANSGSLALTIFPNPGPGFFNINLSTATSEPAQIIISNIIGEKVKELTVETNKEIGLQLNAHRGIYFLTATTRNEFICSKIVVE